MGLALWLGWGRGDSPDNEGRERPAKPRLVPNPSLSRPSSVSPELETLAHRIRAGDAEAFATFVTSHYERATNIAYGVVRSLDAAQDIAQDVFVRLWERREHLDATWLTPAYVLSAAHYRALNVLRGERVRIRHREQTAVTEAPTQPSGEETLLTHATVESALAALPERWATALRLRFQEQMTVPDIALILRISPNATHQLLHRALRELRTRLGDLEKI